jgi:hypothetical protein
LARPLLPPCSLLPAPSLLVLVLVLVLVLSSPPPRPSQAPILPKTERSGSLGLPLPPLLLGSGPGAAADPAASAASAAAAAAAAGCRAVLLLPPPSLLPLLLLLLPLPLLLLPPPLLLLLLGCWGAFHANMARDLPLVPELTRPPAQGGEEGPRTCRHAGMGREEPARRQPTCPTRRVHG